MSGWSLNVTGVKEVRVYLDGEYKGSAEIGKSRDDVNVAFPGYPGGENSGYEYIIDKNQVAPGNHTINVESVGIDGSKLMETFAINMVKPESKTFIDYPRGNVILNDKNMEVSGWALMQVELKK